MPLADRMRRLLSGNSNRLIPLRVQCRAGCCRRYANSWSRYRGKGRALESLPAACAPRPTIGTRYRCDGQSARRWRHHGATTGGRRDAYLFCAGPTHPLPGGHRSRFAAMPTRLRRELQFRTVVVRACRQQFAPQTLDALARLLRVPLRGRAIEYGTLELAQQDRPRRGLHVDAAGSSLAQPRPPVGDLTHRDTEYDAGEGK